MLHSSTRASVCRRMALGLGALASLLSACDRGDILEIIGEVRPWDGAGTPGAEPLAFEVFKDEVGEQAARERRVLLKTRDAYETFFGHAPPASVDFDRDWVIFYSAGRRPGGGFEASMKALMRVGGRLQAVTQLESPGKGCVVSDAITMPHVLVKFRAQPSTSAIDFTRQDVTNDCGTPTNPCAAILCPVNTQCVVLESFPPQAKCVPIQPPDPGSDPCSTVRCAKGTHCEARPVTCVRAPCPPIAECVPDSATAEKCGANTCATGEYCCNASCGICAPKGGVCIQIACN